MPSNLILYFCDTETTNLDPKIGDIIEVSLIRSTDLQQKTWHIKPTNPDGISDKALEVNGINKDDLLWKTAAGKEKYALLNSVLPQIENWVAEDGKKTFDRVLVGHNVKFDEAFLQESWKKDDCFDSYPFSAYGNLIDTKSLALMIDWITGTTNFKYNLESCIKRAGITAQKFHGAAADIDMTKQLFMKYVEMMKSGLVK